MVGFGVLFSSTTCKGSERTYFILTQASLTYCRQKARVKNTALWAGSELRPGSPRNNPVWCYGALACTTLDPLCSPLCSGHCCRTSFAKCGLWVPPPGFRPAPHTSCSRAQLPLGWVAPCPAPARGPRRACMLPRGAGSQRGNAGPLLPPGKRLQVRFLSFSRNVHWAAG